MDAATRLQYLEAMGIDVWVYRHPPVAGQIAVSRDQQLHRPETADASEIQQHAANPASIETEKAVSAPGLQALPESETESGGVRQSESDLSIEVRASEFMPEQHPHEPGNEHAWHALKDDVAACRACGLCETRTQTVFGVGNHHAKWMLIGEAPGQNEDLQGEPFVGRAGQLLNEMLRAIGLRREQVFIANILKCRPPGNRDPQANEVASCHDFLLRQIALIQPKIILAVGRIAAQNLLQTEQPLAKLRGRQHQLQKYPLVVVHHPAYLLRSLTEKAKAWDDLQFALSLYQSLEE